MVEEFVFYGLPMFYVGATPPPVAAPVAPTTVTPSNLPDAGFGGLKVATVVATPNFTGTATAPNPVVTPSGSFYTVGGQTLDVNGRPIQPLYTSDITRPDWSPATLHHGADVEGRRKFRSRLLQGVDHLRSAATRISRRVVPGGAGIRAQLPGRRQRPSAAPARRRPVPWLGRRGHAERRNREYSACTPVWRRRSTTARSNPTDITAPSIDRSRGFVDDGVAFFEVSASDVGSDVKRVFILFRGTTGTTWTGLDLAKGPDGVWRGGRGFTGDRIEFAVQAVDGSGNVAMSNSKSLFFLDADPVAAGTARPRSDAGGTRRVHQSVVHDRRRCHHHRRHADHHLQRRRSGVGVSTRARRSRVSGDGGHVITAFDPATGLVAELYVAIDSTPPSASIPVPDGFVKGPQSITADIRRRRRRRGDEHHGDGPWWWAGWNDHVRRTGAAW